MDDYLKEALEIVKAQANVRTMTEEEITSMLRTLTNGLRDIGGGSIPKIVDDFSTVPAAIDNVIEPAKAIKEKNIICVECGKAFKLLTKKHLATHGLTPEEYRERCGYKKNTPLVCKSLQRERRKKMKDMKLWERRRDSKA